MKYTWENKARLVLEHLHKGTTPEEVLELMSKTGVFTVTKEEKDIILKVVYSSRNHVYFGGTWDPVELMNKSPVDCLSEIKETLDKMVEEGTIPKESRDRRWKEILDKCNHPKNPEVERNKRRFERIESLLKDAKLSTSQRRFQRLKTKVLKELYRIGCCYENGDGVDKDEVEAVKWYRMAADQDFVSAIFALSKCYALGIGVRRNRVTATKLLSKCADKGDVVSMRILGICYQEGRGIERSPRKAAWWFRRAADNNDPWGMFYLGECFENGDGERKDPDEAYLWFCRAVMADPYDEHLYQSVQNKIFDPNLKECREKMLKESANENEEVDVCDK